MIEGYFEGLQPHINCEEGDIAEIVLLPGDPDRVEEIAEEIDSYERISEKREFTIYSGKLEGRNVTVASTGIGCPSAAIAVEELAICGAKVFIRVGTTGAIQEDVALGDVIIAEAAVRSDGTTREYVDVEYPAVASVEVIEALKKAAEEAKVRCHAGMVRTNDAFYGAPDFESIVKKHQKLKVLSFEMECAAVFTVARLRGLKAGAVLGVVGNIVTDEHVYKSKEYEEKAKEAEKSAIKVAVGAVKYL